MKLTLKGDTMKNENADSKDALQELFEKYKNNDSDELKAGLMNLSKEEQKEFIKHILNYENDNWDNGTLKSDEKFNVIFPPNFKVVMEFEKANFNGAILSDFIEALEEWLEHEEMELYDDPADFEGGDYFDGDPDDDEDGLAEMTLDDWVADQTGHLRDFIDSLKDFK